MFQFSRYASASSADNRGLLDRVSPFGHPRVKGCYTPHRGLSQLRHVLLRSLMSRHPPLTLNIFMSLYLTLFCNANCSTEQDLLYLCLKKLISQDLNCQSPLNEKTAFFGGRHEHLKYRYHFIPPFWYVLEFFI